MAIAALASKRARPGAEQRVRLLLLQFGKQGLNDPRSLKHKLQLIAFQAEKRDSVIQQPTLFGQIQKRAIALHFGQRRREERVREGNHSRRAFARVFLEHGAEQ